MLRLLRGLLWRAAVKTGLGTWLRWRAAAKFQAYCAKCQDDSVFLQGHDIPHEGRGRLVGGICISCGQAGAYLIDAALGIGVGVGQRLEEET